MKAARSIYLVLAIFGSGIWVTTFASAQSEGARPDSFQALVDCRAITDSAERLACYDVRVAALEAAEKNRQVAIVDRAQIRQARRSLFGLVLPHIAIFDGTGRDREEAAEFTEIESTIKTARQDPNGRWVVSLEDGARWFQIDNRDLSIPPRPGQKIRIRAAAMGSFLANINGQIAIRMERRN